MTPSWKTDLAAAFRTPEALLAALGLPCDPAAHPRLPFPMLCTRHYAAKMRRRFDDPLLRQVLASAAERDEVPGFGCDPVGDAQAQVEPGFLHKYQGRLLVVTGGACAIHCRFCFRREFPYADADSRDQPERLAARLSADPSIEEVILSGGDPLLLDDDRLEAFYNAAASSPAVRRVRIHSRVPLLLPSRFGLRLRDLLANPRLRTVLVLHCNHAAELDEDSALLFRDLQVRGVHLLNQSVLLAGVNDSEEALADLSQALFAQGVLPYYLHQLDRVKGAAHFEVSDSRALDLVEALRQRLPGYLVPRLVREEAGEPSKTPLGSLRSTILPIG